MGWCFGKERQKEGRVLICVFSKWTLKAIEEFGVVKDVFLYLINLVVLSVIQTVHRGLFRFSITSVYRAISAEKQKSNSIPVVDSYYLIPVDLSLETLVYFIYTLECI
jgi:hypothetical protein